MLRNTWPLIALAVLGACVATFGIAAFDWAAWTCQQPTSEAGKPFALGPGACFEFWLNRYQTIVAAMVALATAFVAVQPVLSQLREMRRQTIQREIEAAEKRIIDISTVDEMLAQVLVKGYSLSLLGIALLNATNAFIGKEYAERLVLAEQEFEKVAESAISQLRAFFNPNDDQIKRGNFIDGCYGLLNCSRAFTFAMITATDLAPNIDRLALGMDKGRGRLSQIEQVHIELCIARNEYFAPLEAERSGLYSLIRQLQASAKAS